MLTSRISPPCAVDGYNYRTSPHFRVQTPVTNVPSGSLELRCCAGSRSSPTLRQAPGPVLGAPPGRGQGRASNAHRWPNTTAETRRGGRASCSKAPPAPALGTLLGRHPAGRRRPGPSLRPNRHNLGFCAGPSCRAPGAGGPPRGWQVPLIPKGKWWRALA